jgi:RNA polymerase sigma-70 factor (ECF subfamily)
MEISRNIQILKREKKEAICQELEITTSNYWQIVHRSKLLLKKCLELKWV